jgi:hypothetical protein
LEGDISVTRGSKGLPDDLHLRAAEGTNGNIPASRVIEMGAVLG